MAVDIRFENVTKSFDGQAAVKQVSLAIAGGELFFLLGPSGCGKTTLLRCLAGFYTPEEGRIFIGSEEITRQPPERRNTGMVFQGYALWPHLSVRENVAFGLDVRKVARTEITRRVKEALDRVRMADRADDKPNQLSGGQQQRVALARALVIEPRCLLLDEPLSSLDAQLRLEMRSEIRKICKEAGLTALYVTHDQKEALSIADRMAVMEGGVIRQCGTPREVYQHPNSRFVAHFLGETNFIDGLVDSCEASTVRIQTPLGLLTSTAQTSTVLRCGQKVSVSLRPEAFRLTDASEKAPNLFLARLRENTYMGEVAHYKINTGGLDLQMVQLNPAQADLKPGQALHCTVDPANVIILDA